jgi:hypothetical protein
MTFSSLVCKFKLKFKLQQSLKLLSFELTRFYCNGDEPFSSITETLHLLKEHY